MLAIKLVNKLLELGIDVWWVQKKEDIYQPGDFIVVSDKVEVKQLLKQGNGIYLAPQLSIAKLESFAKKIIKPKIAVYYGDGTAEGAIWFIQVFEKMGFEIGLVKEEDILKGKLENYNVLVLGSGTNYCSYIGKEGCKKIEEFVHKGGGYIGHCGGAVAAVKHYPGLEESLWLELADISLALKDKRLLYSPIRGFVIYKIVLPEHPVMFGYKKEIPLLYWWGPIFSEIGKEVTLLATISDISPEIEMSCPEIAKINGIFPSIKALKDSIGKPAILTTSYGNGKVLISSPHPESPESRHSYRLVANEVFYVTSFSNSPKKLDNVSASKRVFLETETIKNFLNEIEELRNLLYRFIEKDKQIYGSLGETLLLYLEDSINRLKKVQILITDEMRKVVQDIKKFLLSHFKNLDNRSSEFIKKEYQLYLEILNAYKYCIEEKILRAYFFC